MMEYIKMQENRLKARNFFSSCLKAFAEKFHPRQNIILLTNLQILKLFKIKFSWTPLTISCDLGIINLKV